MTLKNAIALLGAVSLAAMIAPIAQAAPAKSKAATASLVTSQLPRNAVPKHYTINATPDAKNLAFTAQTSIDIAVKTAGPSITLNAAELTFKSVTIRSAAMQAMPAKITVDEAKQTATFTFDIR
jgi:aminopeptidase N